MRMQPPLTVLNVNFETPGQTILSRHTGTGAILIASWTVSPFVDQNNLSDVVALESAVGSNGPKLLYEFVLSNAYPQSIGEPASTSKQLSIVTTSNTPYILKADLSGIATSLCQIGLVVGNDVLASDSGLALKSTWQTPTIAFPALPRNSDLRQLLTVKIADAFPDDRVANSSLSSVDYVRLDVSPVLEPSRTLLSLLGAFGSVVISRRRRARQGDSR